MNDYEKQVAFYKRGIMEEENPLALQHGCIHLLEHKVSLEEDLLLYMGKLQIALVKRTQQQSVYITLLNDYLKLNSSYQKLQLEYIELLRRKQNENR